MVVKNRIHLLFVIRLFLRHMDRGDRNKIHLFLSFVLQPMNGGDRSGFIYFSTFSCNLWMVAIVGCPSVSLTGVGGIDVCVSMSCVLQLSLKCTLRESRRPASTKMNFYHERCWSGVRLANRKPPIGQLLKKISEQSFWNQKGLPNVFSSLHSRTR